VRKRIEGRTKTGKRKKRKEWVGEGRKKE